MNMQITKEKLTNISFIRRRNIYKVMTDVP